MNFIWVSNDSTGRDRSKGEDPPSAEVATLTVRTSLINTAGSSTKNFQITCPALSQTSSYKCPTQGQQGVDASLAGEGKKRGDSKWVSDKCLYDEGKRYHHHPVPPAPAATL